MSQHTRNVKILPLVLMFVLFFSGSLFVPISGWFSHIARAQIQRLTQSDNLPPDILSFSINHGDALTDLHEVTLQLEASDNDTAAEEMQVRLRNEGEEWTDWQLYRGEWQWTLPGGDGAKFVYAEVRDLTGNSASATAAILVYVPVQGISLDRAYLLLEAGAAPGTLAAFIFPEHASNREIVWSSADPAVAIVEAGTVYPVSAGETVITATTVDGGFIASCAVEVVSAIVPLESLILYGDVGNSGEVDVADAILILRYIVGLESLTPEQLEAADVYQDGTVNISDAIVILRYITGLITSLPVDPGQLPPPPPPEDPMPPPPPEMDYFAPTARLLNATYRVWSVAEINCTELNVRSGPDIQYAILGQVKRGQPFFIREIARTSDPTYPVWYRINFNGNPGWIAANFTVVEDVLYGLDYWSSEVRLAPAPAGLGPGDYKIDSQYNFLLKNGDKLVSTGINCYFLAYHPYAVLPLERPAPSSVTADFLAAEALRHRADTTFHTCADAFIQAQQSWGMNALYLMAHGALESAWGTSKIAKDKNNIFGYGAYDSDPYNGAYTYRSLSDCVMQVGGVIRRAYLSESGTYFRGPYLVGMNEYYATDPMWAVKIANVMHSMIPFSSYDPVAKTLQRARVTAVSLTLYSGPGTGTGSIKTLAQDTRLYIYGRKLIGSTNWVKVTDGSDTGWVNGQHLTLLTQPRGAVYFSDWFQEGKENQLLNVRSGPGTTYDSVGTMPFAYPYHIEVMQVHRDASDGKDYVWYRINYSGGTGWIRYDFTVVDW